MKLILYWNVLGFPMQAVSPTVYETVSTRSSLLPRLPGQWNSSKCTPNSTVPRTGIKHNQTDNYVGKPLFLVRSTSSCVYYPHKQDLIILIKKGDKKKLIGTAGVISMLRYILCCSLYSIYDNFLSFLFNLGGILVLVSVVAYSGNEALWGNID